MNSNARNLLIISVLYFLFGFITNLNDILIPHLKRACELSSDFASVFVQFAFFGAYFIMSIPAAGIIKKMGYKTGISIGLSITALGAFLFIPAAQTRIYEIFLVALAILASGITLLQVAANPYVSLLGTPEKGASRLSLMGGLNSLGASVGPFAGGILFLSSVKNYTADEIALLSSEEKTQWLTQAAESVIAPYATLGIILLILAGMIRFSKLPELQFEAESNSTSFKLWEHKQLIMGIIGIFVYVGAEVGIGSFIIRYGQSLQIDGFTDLIGSRFVTGYMVGAMIFRFIGSALLEKRNPLFMLTIFALAAIILLLCSILSTGYLALVLAILTGACNSIMWPVIFPHAIKNLGIHTNKGSSYLIMAVVGGAIIPLIMGYISDKSSISIAYFVPLLCYVYIAFYGLKYYKTKSV